MKKILCVLLAVLFINVPAYAEDNDYISEDIVARAKEVCGISDEYAEMNVESISGYGDMTMYDIRWRNKDENLIKSEIRVSIGSDGTVYRYSYRDLSDYMPEDKSEIYTDKQARETAEAFLKKALGDKYASLEYAGISNDDDVYRFLYSIKSGDIPYYNNNVTVLVNKFSRCIINYDYSLPVLQANDVSIEGARSIDEARQSVLENMRLGYDTKYEYGKDAYIVTPVYRPKSCMLDAFTLEAPETAYLYKYTADTAASKGASNSRMSLTEAEIKGIEESKNVLSLEKAVSLYNGIFGKSIGVKDVEVDYEREERANYYITRIYAKPESEEQFSASFDVWGRLINYYTIDLFEEFEPDYEKEKKCAEDFINKLNIKYPVSDIDIYHGSCYANIMRNGIVSFDESISMSFDKDMNITSFNARYYPDSIYDGIDGVKEDREKALAKAEELYPLSLYYYIMVEYPNNKASYKTIPVYAFEDEFSVNASTMEVLDYYGRSIEKNEGIHTYTDLNGQWYAEYAEKLAYMGYSFKDAEFGGDKYLTAGDLKDLDTYSSDLDDLIEEHGEDYVISRYEMAEGLTKSYKDITKYSDIFIKPYEDVDDEHKGAVAVLKAMGVLGDADKFRGNDSITRGEAAAMIYRVVTR